MTRRFFSHCRANAVFPSAGNDSTTMRASPSRMFIHDAKNDIPSTDCSALSAAPLEPLLFTGEVRDVADVSSAHASWMTAMSARSELLWMVTLGRPTYRAIAARLRLANGSLLPFFSRGMATICMYTVLMAAKL